MRNETSRDVGPGAAHPVDLDAVTTRARFGELLTEVRQRSGRSLRDLAAAVGSSPSTLSGWCRADNLPFPSQFDTFRAMLRELGIDDPEPWVATLVTLRQARPGRATEEVAPYPGLAAFGREDATRFFGREALVARTIERLRTVLSEPGRPRILLLVGASGSGKSSLLHAGLAPALEAAGLATTAITPGSDAVARLRALDGHPDSAAPVLLVDQLEEVFTSSEDEATPRRFLQALQELADPARTDGTAVIAAIRIDFYAELAAVADVTTTLEDAQIVVDPLAPQELRRAIVEPARQVGIEVEEDLVSLLLRDFLPSSSVTRVHDAGSLPLLSHALQETYRRAAGGNLTVAAYHAAGGLHGAVERSAEEVYLSYDDRSRELLRQVLLRLVHVENGTLATRRVASYDELEGLLDQGAEDGLTELLEPFVQARLLTTQATTVEISHEALLAAWPRLQDWIERDRDAIRLHRRIAEATQLWLDSREDESALARGVLLQAMRDATQPGAGSLQLTSTEERFLAASVDRTHAEERTARQRTRRLAVLATVTSLLAVLAATLTVVAGNARAEALLARDEALSRQLALVAERLAETDPSLGAELAVAGYDIAGTTEARSALLDAAAAPRATRMLGGPGTTVLAASRDGAVVAVGDSAAGAVQLIVSGEPGAAPQRAGTIPLDDPDLEIYALALAPDARVLAVGDTAARVALWDVSDPTAPTLLAEELRGPEGPIQHLDFSPDGTEVVAVGLGDGAFRWDVTDPASPVDTALLPTDDITWSAAYHPAGNYLAVGDERGRITLWDLDDPAAPVAVSVVQPTDRSVLSLAFSPDGELLVAGSRGSGVYAFEITAVADPSPVTIPEAEFDSWINTVAFTADGNHLAVGSSDGQLRLWERDGWRLLGALRHPAALTSVGFTSSPERLLTGAADGTLRRWELDEVIPTTLEGRVWGLGVTDDGTRLAAFSGQETGLFDVSRARTAPRLAPPVPAPTDGPTFSGGGALSPDGGLLAHGTLTGEVLLYDVSDPLEPIPVGAPLGGSDQLVETVAFSPDGSLLAAGGVDTDVRLWSVDDPTAPRELAVLAAPGEIVLNLAFDPQGRLLAAPSADNHTYLFDLADPAAPVALPRLDGFDSEAYAAAFSPDGRVLATAGSDAEVVLWDVTDPRAPEQVGAPIAGPTGRIYDLAFDRDGHRLAGAVVDGRTWVWDVTEPTEVRRQAVLGTGSSPMYTVAFHPERDLLVASGADGLLRRWELDTDLAAAAICAGVGDVMTEEEWSLHLPERAYDPPCV